MELFSAEQVSCVMSEDVCRLDAFQMSECFSFQNTCNDGNIPIYRLNGYITKEGLNLLVDYAYTAKLEVPDEMVSLKCDIRNHSLIDSLFRSNTFTSPLGN